MDVHLFSSPTVLMALVKRESVYVCISSVCMCYSSVIYVGMVLISSYVGGTTSFFFGREGATDCGYI